MANGQGQNIPVQSQIPDVRQDQLEIEKIIQQAPTGQENVVIEGYGEGQTLEEAFPIEQSALTDLGHAIFNTGVVDTIASWGQALTGVAQTGAKMFADDDFDKAIDEYFNGVQQDLQEWKHHNVMQMSDASQKLGKYKDEYTINWLAGGVGGLLGFGAAIAADVALLGGAGTAARVGKAMFGARRAVPTLSLIHI